MNDVAEPREEPSVLPSALTVPGKSAETRQLRLLFRADRFATVDLSIVVPVYNVAPYLERCLASFEGAADIARQIIVVDDGSTDDGLEIALAWAKRQSHLSLIIVTQPNGWLSRARNIGTGFATGEYVAYVEIGRASCR